MDDEMARAEHASCRCERAVLTAYRELRLRGTPDPQAFGACTTLYRIHHPEASMNEARLLVAEWIDVDQDAAPGGDRPNCPAV